MAQENTSTADRQKDIQTGREQRPGVGGRGLARSSYTSPVSTGSAFSLMRRMAEDMDRLFDIGFGGRLGTGLQSSLFDDDLWSGREQPALWSPPLEMVQRGDKLVVRADLPGLKKEDVNVEVDNGVLMISGERKHESEEDRDGFYRSERSYGQFYRSVPLPEGVNAEQCEASFRDGVLEVTLSAPRQETRKARKIQVR